MLDAAARVIGLAFVCHKRRLYEIIKDTEASALMKFTQTAFRAYFCVSVTECCSKALQFHPF
jgi:hypothetical protein